MATRHRPVRSARPRRAGAFLTVLGFLFAAACSSSSDAPPPGIAPEPEVGSKDMLPGLVVTITAVRGGTGVGGNFTVGDRPVVDFTVATEGGAPLELSTFARGAIMISGPTFNYNRVIASQSDVIATSVKRDLGAYTYTFAVPIPATYLAPYNDTPALTDGELTGTALLDGTYTVAMELRKDYTVDDETFRDPGNATFDFLLGSASTLAPREVVTLANCNQCHGELSLHGNNRLDVKNCVVCHTAGAEDGNDPAGAGGTPGVTIEFKVMIHKIHAGATLPSVNGVTTSANGTRDYTATPTPYVVQGRNASLHDYSQIVFPVWPSFAAPMPADAGYDALSGANQDLEDTIRRAPVACWKCHGDPDGAGPLPAPAQGDLAYAQPSRRACGACHDDWDPTLPYRSNNITMPPQLNDAECKECHDISGGLIAVMDAHTHPLVNPSLAEGLVFDVQSVADVGNGNGQFETGERVAVTMTIKDASGADVAASSLGRIEAVLTGPTTNPNLVHYVRIAPAGLGAAASYTFNLPQNFYYEPIGTSTGAGGEIFSTLNAPHWNVSGAATALLRRTGTTSSTTLAAGAAAHQNYIDVVSATGFARNDYIVVEDLIAGRREYLRIQNVEGNRLWFSSQYSQNYAPGLLTAHAAGSSVDEVTVASVPTANYSLDALTGVITETSEFGPGEILASYTSDFTVPAEYPGTLNESPDNDQTWGDWIGLPLLAGTYDLGIYGRRTFTVGSAPDTTDYNEASQPNVTRLLFGTATTVEVVDRIDSSANCYSCHNDIQFHGGSRRGVETCLLCHGNAGAEDAPTYVYSGALPTTGVAIEFRNMLHKIHHGKELSAGAGYVVNGFGGTGHTYEMVGFPRMPGGTKHCTACHGKDNTAWLEPAERLHPGAALPTRVWRAACGSCHDATAAQAHIDANTSASGFEACAVCHGDGKDHEVRSAHLVR